MKTHHEHITDSTYTPYTHQACIAHTPTAHITHAHKLPTCNTRHTYTSVTPQTHLWRRFVCLICIFNSVTGLSEVIVPADELLYMALFGTTWLKILQQRSSKEHLARLLWRCKWGPKSCCSIRRNREINPGAHQSWAVIKRATGKRQIIWLRSCGRCN